MPTSDSTPHENRETDVVRRPNWTNCALIAWIAATVAIYYYNFTQTFYQANQSSIKALFDKLF